MLARYATDSAARERFCGTSSKAGFVTPLGTNKEVGAALEGLPEVHLPPAHAPNTASSAATKGRSFEQISRPGARSRDSLTHGTEPVEKETNMPLINAGIVPSGTFQGAAHGATISVIFDDSAPGHGPRLHRHPYDETWIVEDGTVTFQAGNEQLRAGAGDIVVVPPGVAHKFTKEGPGRSKLVCIHANPTMVTEWLE